MRLFGATPLGYDASEYAYAAGALGRPLRITRWGHGLDVLADAEHAVVTRPDARKGEQLVLFTSRPDATPAALQAWGRANGVTELMLPKAVRIVPALPVLGTGKLDYVTMTAQAAASGEVAPDEPADVEV